MNCSEIQKQLSAYHDGELASEMRKVVAEHVGECERCASRLAEFARYSSSFSQLPHPKAPPNVWEGIAAELGQEADDKTVVTQQTAHHGDRALLPIRRLALAASVLLVLGLGFWLTRHSDPVDSGHSDSEHGEFALTMDHYFNTLATDPDQAEKFLLAKYDGRIIEPEDAVRLVGYRPAVASGLPDEYTLASTSVLKMPCCTCIKAVCKRNDGSTVVLFEHDDEETEWFGDRPTSIATCGDKECYLVDLDSSIAATWKRGSRWVTAVGARDRAEVSELVNWLEHKAGPKSLPL